jgi:hypothetical protein
MDVAEIHVYSKSDTGSSVLQFKMGLKAANASYSYIIKSASGLGPEEIMTQYYGRSGGTLTKYFKPTMKERIVTLLLRLNPQYHLGESPESLRKQVYKALSYGLTTELQLKFVNTAGDEVASLYGFMSQVEPGLFSIEPQLQITFTCKNAFFESSIPEIISASFTGTAYSWNDLVSDAPHGYELYFKFAGNGGPFTLTTVTPFGNAPFYINYSFLTNDILYVNSKDGKKTLNVARPSYGTINLANYVDPLSIWPVMYPGLNTLNFTTAAASGSYISNQYTFWGV